MSEITEASDFLLRASYPVEVERLLAEQGGETVRLEGVEMPLGEVLKRLPRARYANVDAIMEDVRLVVPAVVGDRSPGPGQVE